MVQLPLGQIDTVTIQAVDADGNPVPFQPDSPPVWSNGAPQVIKSQPSSDGLTDVVTPLAAGSTSLSVSASVGGKPFSASDTETVVSNSTVPAMRAEITLTTDNVVRVFDISNPTGSLPDYTCGTAIQKNIWVRDPAIPLTVWFRPDSNTSRIEAVVEWGDLRAPATTKPYTIAYTFKLYVNNALVNTTVVPAHWWGSRWRYQSAPRPVIFTPAQIVAAKILPNFVNKGQAGRTAAPAYTIMGHSNITLSMGTTGERIDIGPVTEDQGWYLATGSAIALASILAWAECSGSIQWHDRDTNMLPVNYETDPNKPVANNNTPSTDPLGRSPWSISGNHVPALTFLPFVLTRDLYFLEEMQFQSASCAPGFSTLGTNTNEARAVAWDSRDQLNCRTAQELIGNYAGALPASYWVTRLGRNLASIITAYLNAPALSLPAFLNVVGSQIHFGPWQQDYLGSSLHTAILRGYTEWRPIYDAYCRQLFNRCGAVAAYPKQHPIGYYYNYAIPAQQTTDSVGKIHYFLTMYDGTVREVYIGSLPGRTGVKTDAIDPATGKTYNITPDIGIVYIDENNSWFPAHRYATWNELAGNQSPPVIAPADGNLDPTLATGSSANYFGEVVANLNFADKVMGVAEAGPLNAWYQAQPLVITFKPNWRWSF